MISTYGGVLSAIEKALQDLMEEYRGVGKSLRVKIVDGGLYFILFLLLFYFTFLFLFNFLFLEQLGLGFISHAVTSVTN